MASTTEGAALTEESRRRQNALRAMTTRQVIQLWPAFTLDDIDASWSRVQPALVGLIQRNRALSASIGQSYYPAFRAAEGVSGPLPQLGVLDDAWRREAVAGLTLNGPIATKKLIAANAPNPLDVALVRVIGTTSRLVLDGGRDVVQEYVLRDERALGYARVTGGNPCAFCAMLASRGPVYKEDTVNFASHDHCQCFSEAVFRRGQPWPWRSREFRQMWNETTEGLSGAEARNAFRRAIEGR